MENKRILIIDEDQKLIIELKEKLLALDFKVSIAINGVIALQKILNNPPDLIIMELDLKIISGEKISQIARANPKMSDIPFFFLSNKAVELDTFNKQKDTFILKPFNFDEFTSKVESHFKRTSPRSADQAELTNEISGHLSQISLVDLLQVFHMNKKSGRLIIKYKDKNGIILIKNGNVINAQIDNVEGEKAFFRLMRLKEERFNFLPEDFLEGGSTGLQKINVKPDNLMMEGLRQLDEWEEMKDNFPNLNSTVKAKIDLSTMNIDIKPISQEIFVLMEFYSKVSDIVDGCSFSDYEVLKSLYGLIEKGIIEEITSKEKEEDEAVFMTPEQMMKIKKRLIETKSFRGNRQFEKVLVVGENFGALKKIIQMFLHLKEFNVNQKDLISATDVDYIGILGKLKLTDEMNILFYSIPMQNKFMPLWNAFSVDSMGVFLLMPKKCIEESERVKDTYDFFNKNIGKPIMPIVISEEYLDETEKKEIKNSCNLPEIYNHSVNDKDGIRDFFVNLFVEIL
ncbi:DUF4388 domain-containing protein [Thermodesulfobacteriota bacterium]